MAMRAGVAVVERLEHDDLVARLAQREQRGGDGLGGAGGHEHLGVGVELEAVEAALVLGDRLPQLGDAEPGRVLVVPAAIAADAARRRAHLGGPVGVGEALAEVDRAGRGGQRRHLGEDRRAEALRLP